MIQDPPVTAGQSWPDYRAVWRWHFYAGLFCIPFVIILSISGGIYLFKTEIEDWTDAPYDRLELHGQPASAERQIHAALAAVPDSSLNGYELPKSIHSAARVIVRQNGQSIRVYVHPESLEILYTLPENERFMRWIREIHGELMIGDNGSLLVELAASWTMIMIVTGLYLWWPRNARGFAGVLYPRLRGGSRMFWRDIHSVTGIWISTLTLFLILSGLPWSKSWGTYLKAVRRLTGTAVARQDWSNSSERSGADRSAGESGEHSGHSGSGRRRGEGSPTKDLSAVDRIVAIVTPLELAHPVVIAPPRGKSTHWTAKSMTANRPLRVNLAIDSDTGEIVSRDGFADRHFIDKVVAVGIAAHEGRLFGWPNQVLGLLTALGLNLLSVSGIILWWKRRDQGVLGAPKAVLSPRIAYGLIILLVLFGLYFPLFGASLLVVLSAEWLVLRRIRPVCHWLGLDSPTTSIAT